MDRFLLADMADLVEASLQPRIHEPQDEDMTSIAATKSPAEKVPVNKSAYFLDVLVMLLLSEAWGKMIHKKTRSKKSRDTVL